MCIGSCKSGRRACNQCVGDLAASVSVGGVVKTATVTVPVERFVPRCSERAVASECGSSGHRATQALQ